MAIIAIARCSQHLRHGCNYGCDELYDRLLASPLARRDLNVQSVQRKYDVADFVLCRQAFGVAPKQVRATN